MSTEPAIEIVNPDARTVKLKVTLPSGKVMSIASNDLVVDDGRTGCFLIEALKDEGVKFYRTKIMGNHDRAMRKRYEGLAAEEVNPRRADVTLTVTLPSGKTLRVPSRNLIVDENREGASVAAHLEDDGVPFFRTLIMTRHLVKEDSSSSTT